MSKRLPYTPASQIRTALRKLWLRSRERQAALKRDGYSCQRCGVKQSKAKGKEQTVEVHHQYGIDGWDYLIGQIRLHLLINPELLETLCPECHKKEHGNANNPSNKE
jgi:5-methylcytosine-specific restriction endonuclease McrA